MIFVINEDVSEENSIGDFSIKSLADMADSTVDLIDFYGKTWSEDAQLAIDDFLVALEANIAIKSKIKILYIPSFFPTTDYLYKADIEATGIYTRNLVDYENDLDLKAGFLTTNYGAIKVTSKGMTLFNDPSGEAHSTSGLEIENIDGFGITNRAMHWGVYIISDTPKFVAGSASSFRPYMKITSSTQDINTYNYMGVSEPMLDSSIDAFYMLNSSNGVGTSYVDGVAVATEVIGTNTENIQTNLGVINGTGNTMGDSSIAFETFGEPLTDLEAETYVQMVNNLMSVLKNG